MFARLQHKILAVQRLSYAVFMLSCAMLCSVAKPGFAQEAGRHALIIGGLGGSPDHTTKFQNYIYETRKALVEQFNFEEANIHVLAEASIQAEDYVDDLSNAENIRAAFASLANTAGASDHVFIILFGHGGYDNGEARLNIPRRDLTQTDFADLVDGLAAGRVVFINTSSARAPYVETLSGATRVVITATRTGTQKNETNFPRFMVEAMTSAATDLDKDNRISVAELFSYAAEKTEQWFADNGNIPTENAMLDDNGDQTGSRLEELENGADGHLAGLTYLSPATAALASAGGEGMDPNWLRERESIEVEIANLKSKKSNMEEDAYYDELEVLFVKLARGNATAESGK